MQWTEWEPFYRKIVTRLSLEPKRDYEATALLSELIAHINPSPLLNQLESSIKGREIIVFGSGPSLEHHIEFIKENIDLTNSVIVAADGAVSALLEHDMTCHFLVTDLDGNPQDLLETVSRGSIAIVHAHGDNIQVISEMVPEMREILGSTQVKPMSNVFLWGGFTDGDRACYLVSHYVPKKIILAGMDFGTLVGKWSKPGHNAHFPAAERKQIKLDIAQDLLAYLWSTRNIVHSSMEDIVTG